MLAPISKLGLVASKPGALIKAVGELAHIGKGATKALGVAEAAAAAGALFSKRKFDMIARCPVETAATESADKPVEAPRPPVAAERPPEGGGAHAEAGLKEVFDNLSEFVAKAGKVVDVAGQLGIGGLGQAAKVLGGLGNASHLAAGALADGWPTGAIANFAGGGTQGSAGAFGDLPTENESAAETARLRLDEPEAAPPDQEASETANVPDNRALLNADKDGYGRGDFGGRDVSKPGDTLTAVFKSNYGHEPSATELIQYANYNDLSSAHDLSANREIISPSLEVLRQEGVSKDQAISYLAKDAQYQAALLARSEASTLAQSADYARSEDAIFASRQQAADEKNAQIDFGDKGSIQAAPGYLDDLKNIYNSNLPAGQKFGMAVDSTKFYFHGSNVAQGSAQAIGGGLEVAGAMGLSSTGLGAVVGVPLAFHGGDNIGTGFSRIFRDEQQNTVTYTGVEGLTGSPRIAGAVDSAIPFMGGVAGAGQVVDRLAINSLIGANSGVDALAIDRGLGSTSGHEFAGIVTSEIPGRGPIAIAPLSNSVGGTSEIATIDTAASGNSSLGWPGTGGAGPVSGTIGITDQTSVAALRNYYPKGGGVEFVYNPATNTFVTGRPATGLFDGSPHEQLAQSIGAGDSQVVGGTLQRGANGEFITTENSGHYGQNWTDANRQQFQIWLSNRVYVPVNHQSWGGQ